MVLNILCDDFPSSFSKDRQQDSLIFAMTLPNRSVNSNIACYPFSGSFHTNSKMFVGRLALRTFRIANTFKVPVFNISRPLTSYGMKMLTLNSVQLPKGAQKKKVRVGRGGKGRTAGRGRKGWKANHGKRTVMRGYEGGQSGIIKKIPKIGIQRKAEYSFNLIR